MLQLLVVLVPLIPVVGPRARLQRTRVALGENGHSSVGLGARFLLMFVVVFAAVRRCGWGALGQGKGLEEVKLIINIKSFHEVLVSSS